MSINFKYSIKNGSSPFGRGRGEGFFAPSLREGWGGIFFIFLLILSFFQPEKIQAQTLEDYLQIAAEENPKIKAAYAQFEAALQQTPQVQSLPDPTLTVSAFGRMIETRMGAQEARFSLMQMFPWFGTLKAKGEVSELMAEAKFQEYLDVREEVFFQIKKMYAELYAIEETVNLQQENLQILDQYKDLGLSSYRSGNASMADVVKIDINRNEAATQIELLREEVLPMKIAFNLMLNRPAEANIVVQDTLFLKEATEFLISEVENHPAVVRFEKQKNAYQAEEKAAEKEGMPMIGLGVDYSIISERKNFQHEMNGQDAIMPMLSVNLPIFRKKYKAARKQAELMGVAMEYEKEMQQNEIISAFEKTLFQFKKSKRLLQLYNEQIERSNQVNSLLISALSTATGEFEDVLQNNQDVLIFQIQKIEALREGFIAQAQLEYLMAQEAN